MLLIERQGYIHYPMTGALINFVSVGEKNGILWGCQIITLNNDIYISPGVLIIQGYRVNFTENELLVEDRRGTTVPRKFNVIIKITATKENAEVEILSKLAGTELTQESIEQTPGVFEFPLLQYQLGRWGISLSEVFIQKIKDLNENESLLSLAIPRPIISIQFGESFEDEDVQYITIESNPLNDAFYNFLLQDGRCALFLDRFKKNRVVSYYDEEFGQEAQRTGFIHPFDPELWFEEEIIKQTAEDAQKGYSTITDLKTEWIITKNDLKYNTASNGFYISKKIKLQDFKKQLVYASDNDVINYAENKEMTEGGKYQDINRIQLKLPTPSNSYSIPHQIHFLSGRKTKLSNAELGDIRFQRHDAAMHYHVLTAMFNFYFTVIDNKNGALVAYRGDRSRNLKVCFSFDANGLDEDIYEYLVEESVNETGHAKGNNIRFKWEIL